MIISILVEPEDLRYAYIAFLEMRGFSVCIENIDNTSCTPVNAELLIAQPFIPEDAVYKAAILIKTDVKSLVYEPNVFVLEEFVTACDLFEAVNKAILFISENSISKNSG